MCLFILFFRFRIHVRSYGICLSLCDLFRESYYEMSFMSIHVVSMSTAINPRAGGHHLSSELFRRSSKGVPQGCSDLLLIYSPLYHQRSLKTVWIMSLSCFKGVLLFLG